MTLITTIEEKCRMCYTCVRECPAKAIRISGGQANIVTERCIGCGNCVRVCSQQAKQLVSSAHDVLQLLKGEKPVVALIAPSFPAELYDVRIGTFIGMIRALGFSWVHEVAIGADLVAQEYNKLVQQHRQKPAIASTCPALVSFVEKYHPNLVKDIAPIVSPMIAASRIARKLHGDDIAVVFIGPCLAKKTEASYMAEDVDLAITFRELRELFGHKHIKASKIPMSDFDPPRPGLGAVFAVSRGLLQAAELPEDLVTSDVVAADGRIDFMEAIKEAENGALEAELLEVLCCQGCVMGTGMTTCAPRYQRMAAVSHYVQQFIPEGHPSWMKSMQDIPLTRHFTIDDQRMPTPSANEIRKILARMGKLVPNDELNCGACGYETCYEHAVAIHKDLAESEMCLPYTIERLRHAFDELAKSHEQLATTQQALMQSERLASMGQLAAGIAHEVNNPLGVVLLYTHMLLDDNHTNPLMQEDLKMIVEQADRCKKIVSGLLNFARKNKVVRSDVNFNQFVDHCLQVITIPSTVSVSIKHAQKNLLVSMDADQITQVLTNIIANAIAAMPDGGKLHIETGVDNDDAFIAIKDTGIGIPQENMSQIFEPFFTTKQIGKGTGLGLAVTYGIIKMHRGRIDVVSNANPNQGATGTCFTVYLPTHEAQDNITLAIEEDENDEQNNFIG